MEKLEKFTVKNKDTGTWLYRRLTGSYDWALKAATDANKWHNSQAWVVYKVEDGAKR